MSTYDVHTHAPPQIDQYINLLKSKLIVSIETLLQAKFFDCVHVVRNVFSVCEDPKKPYFCDLDHLKELGIEKLPESQVRKGEV